MPKYLLDTNIFINSHQQHYGMDYCPAFWDWLGVKNRAGVVFSLDRVCDELTKQEDCICNWAKANGDGFFLEFDQEANDKLSPIADWVNAQSRFNDAAKDGFFNPQKADMYLIAYAGAHKFTVVTKEMPAPTSQKSVKIPDVCAAFGVPYMSQWDLMRAEKAWFVMGALLPTSEPNREVS